MMCWTLKQYHDAELGGNYFITKRDMGEAKELLIANGGEIPEPDTLVSYAKNYFSSNWDGWREQNYPLWGLFRNWNAFAPKQSRPKKEQTTRRVMIINCSGCGTEHDADEQCPKCYPVKA